MEKNSVIITKKKGTWIATHLQELGEKEFKTLIDEGSSFLELLGKISLTIDLINKNN